MTLHLIQPQLRRKITVLVERHASDAETLLYSRVLRKLPEHVRGRREDTEDAHIFYSAICIAATVIFWLCVLSLAFSLEH